MNFSESTPVVVDDIGSDAVEKRVDLYSHRSLFAKRDFKAEEVIAEFSWDKVHATPNYLTVQISEHEHIELMPYYLECANHSCDPNCFFDTKKRVFMAIKPIKAGDELMFFYPSAEWDMDQSFKCICGSKDCIGMIKGAKYLTEAQVKKYRFTDFIQKKLAARA